MEDRCVMCGRIIPEGRQICPICEKGEPKVESLKWISVKDRLPIEEAKAHEQEWCEEYCEFLVMIERGLLPTTLYYDWEENEWFRINTALERETYKVTHWQCLPQPPKGE